MSAGSPVSLPLVQTQESPLTLPVPSITNYVTRSLVPSPKTPLLLIRTIKWLLVKLYLLFTLLSEPSVWFLPPWFSPLSHFTCLTPLQRHFIAQIHFWVTLYSVREFQAPHLSIWGSLRLSSVSLSTLATYLFFHYATVFWFLTHLSLDGLLFFLWLQPRPPSLLVKILFKWWSNKSVCQ